MFENGEGVISSGSCTWDQVTESSCAHSGHGPELLQQSFVEGVHVFGLVVFRSRKTVANGEHVICDAAEVGTAQPHETLDEESGGNE